MSKQVSQSSSIPKLTKADRQKLLKKPLLESEIKSLFKKGLSIWAVTEAYYGRKFDHRRSARKLTWIFYQKINNVRHKLNINSNKVTVQPMTQVAIATYLEKHTEEELRGLLVRK